MEITGFADSMRHLAVNFFYVITSLVTAVLSLIFVDKVMYRKIDFVDEIKKGNIAATIFYSMLLVFVGMLVTKSLS